MALENCKPLSSFLDICQNLDGCSNAESLKTVFAPCASVFLMPIAKEDPLNGFINILKTMDIKSNSWQQLLSYMWATQYIISGPNASTAWLKTNYSICETSFKNIISIIISSVNDPKFHLIKGQLIDAACSILTGIQNLYPIPENTISQKFCNDLMDLIQLESCSTLGKPSFISERINSLSCCLFTFDAATNYSLVENYRLIALIRNLLLNKTSSIRSNAISTLLPLLITRFTSCSCDIIRNQLNHEIIELVRCLVLESYKNASDAHKTLQTLPLPPKAIIQKAKEQLELAKMFRKETLAVLVSALPIIATAELGLAPDLVNNLSQQLISLDAVETSMNQSQTTSCNKEVEHLNWASCSAETLVWCLVLSGLTDEDSTSRKRSRFFIQKHVEMISSTFVLTQESENSRQELIGSIAWASVWSTFLDLLEAAEEFAAHLLKQQWVKLADLCEAAANSQAANKVEKAPVLSFAPVWLEALISRCCDHANANTARFVVSSVLNLLANGRAGLLAALAESGRNATGDAAARKAVQALAADKNSKETSSFVRDTEIRIPFSRSFFFDILIPELCKAPLYGRSDAADIEVAVKAAVTSYLTTHQFALTSKTNEIDFEQPYVTNCIGVGRLLLAAAKHAKHFTPLRVLLETALELPETESANHIHIRAAIKILTVHVRNFPIALRAPTARLLSKVLAKHVKPSSVPLVSLVAYAAALAPTTFVGPHATFHDAPAHQVEGDADHAAAFVSLIKRAFPDSANFKNRFQLLWLNAVQDNSVLRPEDSFEQFVPEVEETEMLIEMAEENKNFSTWLEESMHFSQSVSAHKKGDEAMDVAAAGATAANRSRLSPTLLRGLARVAACMRYFPDSDVLGPSLLAVCRPLALLAQHPYASLLVASHQCLALSSILEVLPTNLVCDIMGHSASNRMRDGVSSNSGSVSNNSFSVGSKLDLSSIFISLSTVLEAKIQTSIAEKDAKDILILSSAACKVIQFACKFASTSQEFADALERFVKTLIAGIASCDIGFPSENILPNDIGNLFLIRILCINLLSACANGLARNYTSIPDIAAEVFTFFLNLDVPTYKFNRDFAANFAPCLDPLPLSPSCLFTVSTLDLLQVDSLGTRDGRLTSFSGWRDVYESIYRSQWDALTALSTAKADTPHPSTANPANAIALMQLIQNPPTNLWGVMAHYFQMVSAVAWPILLPSAAVASSALCAPPLANSDGISAEQQLLALRTVASFGMQAVDAHKDSHLPLWLINCVCAAILHPSALLAEAELLPPANLEETVHADVSKGVWKPIIRNQLQLQAQNKLRRDANSRGKLTDGDTDGALIYNANVQEVSQPCIQFAVRALEAGLVTVGIARGVIASLVAAIANVSSFAANSAAIASLFNGPLTRLLAEIVVFREASVTDGAAPEIAPDAFSPEMLLALHERTGISHPYQTLRTASKKLGSSLCELQLHVGPAYARLLTLASLETFAESNGLLEGVSVLEDPSISMGLRFVRTFSMAANVRESANSTDASRLLDAFGIHLAALIRCTLEKICNPEFGAERRGAGRSGQSTPMPDSFYHRVQLRAWQAMAVLSRVLVRLPNASEVIRTLALEHLMLPHLPDVRHYIEVVCAVFSAFDLDSTVSVLKMIIRKNSSVSSPGSQKPESDTDDEFTLTEDLPVQIASSILAVVGYPLIAISSVFKDQNTLSSLTEKELASAHQIVSKCWPIIECMLGYLTCNAAYVRATCQLITHEFLEAFAAQVAPSAISCSSDKYSPIMQALSRLHSPTSPSKPGDCFVKGIFSYLHESKECIKMRHRTQLFFHRFDPLFDARLGRLLPAEGVLEQRMRTAGTALSDLSLAALESEFDLETFGPCELEDCELKPAWSLVASIKAAVMTEMSLAWHSDEGEVNLDEAIIASREDRQVKALCGQTSQIDIIADKGEIDIEDIPAKRVKIDNPNAPPAASPTVRQTAVQRKFLPWQQDSSVSQQEEFDSLGAVRSHGCRTDGRELIVVASLVNRVPNLAGLCRTCEIFKANLLVLPNLKIAQDAAFQSVSVTAHQWMPLAECTPTDLPEYLRSLKSQGYSLVGLEQTGDMGGKLGHTWTFPKRAALILGAEKEGLSADLISLLDLTVEIPQAGIIRSLNVHVAASLCIWEFVRQAHADACYTGKRQQPMIEAEPFKDPN